MKISFLVWVIGNVALSGVLSVGSRAQAVSEKPSSLEGTVTNQLTGVPIGLADVRLTKQDAPTFNETAVTDVDGHFHFNNLSQGYYSLSTARSEFLSSQSVAVSVGAEPTASRLRLAPLGVIAGTVFAEDGDALSGATVTAMRAAVVKRR